MLLQFQEKSDSSSLLKKLVLGTSGRGACFRRFGRDHRALRVRFLFPGIRVPGALTAQVSPAKFSGPLSPPFTKAKDLAKERKGSGPRLHNPQPFIAPPSGSKGGG